MITDYKETIKWLDDNDVPFSTYRCTKYRTEIDDDIVQQKVFIDKFKTIEIRLYNKSDSEWEKYKVHFFRKILSNLNVSSFCLAENGIYKFFLYFPIGTVEDKKW